jgi:hypothetical protein
VGNVIEHIFFARQRKDSLGCISIILQNPGVLEQLTGSGSLLWVPHQTHLDEVLYTVRLGDRVVSASTPSEEGKLEADFSLENVHAELLLGNQLSIFIEAIERSVTDTKVIYHASYSPDIHSLAVMKVLIFIPV